MEKRWRRASSGNDKLTFTTKKNLEGPRPCIFAVRNTYGAPMNSAAAAFAARGGHGGGGSEAQLGSVSVSRCVCE